MGRNTRVRYSLLADSLPRWYLPEELGQGGDAVGEGGGRGSKEATLVQPASQPSQHSTAQQQVPSAQCHCARASASAKAIRAFLFLCSRFI